MPDTARRGGVLRRAAAVAARRPVTTVAAVALAARLVVAIAVAVRYGTGPFPDADFYLEIAGAKATGDTGWWPENYFAFFDENAGFLVPLSLLYRVFGVHDVVGGLLSATFGAVTAALVCRLALLVMSRGWALLAGLAVALFPSVVLWSALTLKDAEVWAVTAGIALAATLAATATGRRLAALGLAIAALALLMGHLRWHTLVVICCALVIAAVVAPGDQRAHRVAGAVAIAVVIPWASGIGPAGYDFVRSAGSLSALRAANAEGASTAVVAPREFKRRPTGAVRVVQSEAGADDEFSYFPRGLAVMLLEPYPGTSLRGSGVRPAQAELLLWYPLVGLALVGAAELARRRRELVFLGATAVGVLLVYALSEGNFGTAYRHRGELVPPLAVFAALGLRRLWDAAVRRRGAAAAVAAGRAADAPVLEVTHARR